MTKSLITGGAGFIGSHLVDRLVEIGHDVIVIDDLSADCNDKFYFNESARYFQYDICDYENTHLLYKDIDYVFHLAAESRLQPAILNPVKAMEKNVVGTCTVLQCAKESGVKRVVYSSTSSGYGNNSIPNQENQPDDCLNPYSISKVSGEKLCKMYSDLYGLETIVFRYFNVFGERSPSRGQYALVTGIFLRQNMNEEPLTIVGDGSQSRDFIYVKDIVTANILAAVSVVESQWFGKIFNIGSGQNDTIIDLAKIISSDYIFIPKRDGEIEDTLADIERAKMILGWEPKVNIKDWLSDAIK
jgi:UDP-glucose 4-epimerase